MLDLGFSLLVHSFSMHCLIWAPNQASTATLFIQCYLVHPVLTNVIVHDKVPKADPNVPPGFEPLVPKPGVIGFNSRLHKPVVEGREEEATKLIKMGKGKRPRIVVISGRFHGQ